MIGIREGIGGLLSDDDSHFGWEINMDFPNCPVCGSGRLLPLSDHAEPFSLWVCTGPDCSYSLSKNSLGDTYYKGHASANEKEKNGKRWTEFEF